jgi:cold-inducible RNA-binding protein
VNNILVGSLSPNATEKDIRSLFEQHGAIERFKMMIDLKTRQPRGFAFVQMKDDAEAEKAIAATDGTELSGRPIRVSAARPQVHRRHRKGGK